MVNMLYNIIVLEPFTFFYMIYDYVTCDVYVTVTYDVILISNSKSKNKKIQTIDLGFS